MLNKFAHLLLTMTALAPIALTWAIADYNDRGYHWDQVISIVSFSALVLICILILAAVKKQLNRISISLQEVKPVDSEVVAYIVTYLFPLVAPGAVNMVTMMIIFFILALVLTASHAFTFNPVLTFLGYHFYEAKSSVGIYYLLISKSDITDVKHVSCIGKLSSFLIIDLSSDRG